jgi:oligoribonuclease NrnB/cAMP/cGMP phosphodiesterase (DHH superfamily)
MKIACIYHSVDLDGWMSAAIVKHWFNQQEVPNKEGEDCNTLTFIGYNYGQSIPDLSEYHKVIMCDISFSNKGEVAQKMLDLFGMNTKEDKRFIWIDHHDSALKLYHRPNVNYFIHGSLNTKFAACELTWLYFFGGEWNGITENPMPEIVRLLGRYDCFGHKGTDEERIVLEFQYGARAIITNYEEAYYWLTKCIHEVVYKNSDTTLIPILLHTRNISNSGKVIYQYLCTEAKQTYKNGFELSIGLNLSVKLVDITTVPNLDPETIKNAQGTYLPYKFICFNRKIFNPINFGINYHKDGYDGAACFWYENGMWNFSLYNDNDLVDCSVIAKQYGGGGHKGASGFILDNEQFNKLINI